MTAIGSRPRSKIRTGVALAAAAAVGAGAALAGAHFLGGDQADTIDVQAKLSSIKVEHRTLDLTDSTTATLSFVTSTTVSSPVAGTVTGLPAQGDVVAAGTVAAMVDGAPLVALYGDRPGYRDLSASSSAGSDIYQLELNLVALGFDPEAKIHIDETYDAATTAAVKRWQASLGLTASGDVPQSLVVYIPGKVLVDTVKATIGGGVSSGTALFTGRLAERASYVASTSAAAGEVSNLAGPGTKVTTGTVLFTDGGYPVVAIEGDAATTPLLTRTLKSGVAAGADVKLLEQMLAAKGLDAGGTLTVDDTFDSATAQAVAAWYQSLGLTVADPNVVPDGSYVVVPSGLQVGQPLVTPGADPGRETPVITLTAPARVVTTTAPLGDATFKVGAKVTVEFPDASTSPGTVTEIGTVATNATGQPGGQATVPVTIQVDQVPDSVSGFVQIPVTLKVVTQSIPNAYVVPTSALLALAEGGYGLEVVDGPGVSHLIPVETGSFADGFVEVKGTSLADGLSVVVPS